MWSKGGYHNRMPAEIVAVSKNMVSSGAANGATTTMHFEYRPELF